MGNLVKASEMARKKEKLAHFELSATAKALEVFRQASRTPTKEPEIVLAARVRSVGCHRCCRAGDGRC